MQRKKILVLYTGGTIGMKRPSIDPTGSTGSTDSTGSNSALAPAAGYLPKVMRALPELDPALNPGAPEFDLIEYDPLLDSSDMTPDAWVKIATDIEHHYQMYDGFVVLHGTDTLAYTSSALSFFVENTRKPIVVTGSQLPFGLPRSDAPNNIVSALQVAATMPEELAQVCVVFGARILRGNRVTKTSAAAFDAFSSPRFPALGSIGIEITYEPHQGLALPDSTFRVHESAPPRGSVAVIRLFPGFTPQIIEAVCSLPNLKGIVLEAFGSGNGPSSNPLFLDAIKEARQSGVVIVVVAQPIDGLVNFGNYAAGSALGRAGAISGQDLTTEAALTKLYYLISLGLEPTQIESRMLVPLAGEMG